MARNKRSIVLWVLIVSSVILFSYSAYRAFHLSFTHDESLSHSIVAFNSGWYFTANNHPLNTRLMRWCLRWFGDQEWALRLPNVTAHALYLTFGTLLLWELKETVFVVLGFVLLNLNPFLLDFFSLARGYGLALALSIAAFYFFKKAWTHVACIRIFLCLTAGLALAALATLANFAWTDCYLALIVGAFLLLIFRRQSFPSRWYLLLLSASLFAANAWFTYNLAKRLLILSKNGEFYAGGSRGFFVDTVYSLIEFGLYQPNHVKWVWPLMFSIVGIQFGLGFAALFRAIRDREFAFSTFLVLVQLLVSAAIITQHTILHTTYPMDRMALYYLPITALLIVFTSDGVLVTGAPKLRSSLRVAAMMLCAVVIFHFTITANLTHTYTWRYDADTKMALVEMDKLFGGHGKTVKVGNDWALEPSMNYYRSTRHYDWMSVVTRDQLSAPDNDVVYCFPDDLAALPKGFSLVRQFPESGNYLLARTNRMQSPAQEQER